MRILHCADLHLGLSLSQFEEKAKLRIRGEMDRALLKLEEKLASGAYDGLLFVGDIFEDSDVGSNYLMLVTRIFKAQLDRGGFVCYASGNHDFWVREKHFASLRHYEKFFLFLDAKLGMQRFNQGGETVVLYGIGYDEAQPQKDISDLYPAKAPDSKEIVIGLFHGNVHNSGFDLYYTVDLEKIYLKNYNYFAMGHVHGQELYHGTIAYPGTPFPQGYDENEISNVNEVTIEGSLTMVEPVPLVNYRIYNIKDEIKAKTREEVLNKAKTILNEKIEDHAADNIIRLSLTVKGAKNLLGELDEDLEKQIFESYDESSHLVWNPIVEEESQKQDLNEELLSALEEALVHFKEGRVDTDLEDKLLDFDEDFFVSELGRVKRSILADWEED